MTDATDYTVTVEIEVSQTHEYTIADDELAYGAETVHDAALTRAVEHIRGEIINWPLAYVEVTDIRAVGDS